MQHLQEAEGEGKLLASIVKKSVMLTYIYSVTWEAYHAAPVEGAGKRALDINGIGLSRTCPPWIMILCCRDLSR